MMGSGKVEQTVACLLLVAVLSNVQGQRVQLISSSQSDCQVERLESRLSSIEDQLSSMQRIVSTLNNPPIKANCTVNLSAYGYDDSTKYGYVRTSGGSSDDTYTHAQIDRYRGVTIFELDATTCTTRNKQRFDTFHSSGDMRQLLEAMESATMGTIIIGVTADSAEDHHQPFQAVAGSYFTRYNMNIAGLRIRDKFAFIMQKAYPKKTVFERKPQFGESLRLTIALRGSTVSDVTFYRV